MTMVAAESPQTQSPAERFQHGMLLLVVLAFPCSFLWVSHVFQVNKASNEIQNTVLYNFELPAVGEVIRSVEMPPRIFKILDLQTGCLSIPGLLMRRVQEKAGSQVPFECTACPKGQAPSQCVDSGLKLGYQYVGTGNCAGEETGGTSTLR